MPILFCLFCKRANGNIRDKAQALRGQFRALTVWSAGSFALRKYERDAQEKRESIMAEVVLKGVCKNYGEVETVRNVDLRSEDGEFICLLGPSLILPVTGGWVDK